MMADRPGRPVRLVPGTLNRVIKDYIAAQPGLHFIDLWDTMLTADGQPREELWVADRVHPNHAGCLVRVRVMRPILGAPDKKIK